ncbi:single-stranded DNA-binding protein [Georgenia sp. EYE_87]|uniref:single-stranded DNA-binding protein n=1 Tax=Georgenia sp. EYE_87 TaxID=2853448 RepID=UPI002004575E|nr:single-stranded DNA-binding protein [Georgenia sp. EYE_87]MCK6210579.1 single-stranded DNA-binding protein [Georgenia sp. EYE_87]
MSNEIQITVRGWMGSDPVRHVGPTGVTLAMFRVGSTPRLRDRATGEFRDGETQWFTVKAWRDLAENVIASLKKGMPVILRGTLRTETWQGENGERSANVISVDSIGADLGTGTAQFVRTVRASAAAEPGAGDGSATGGDATQSPGAGLTGPDGTRFTGQELPDDPDEGLADELAEELAEADGYALA